MYRRLTAVLILMSAAQVYASADVQAQVRTGREARGTISGRVVGADGAGLANAAITLRVAGDSAILTGTVTRRDGRFELAGLSAGEYDLHLSLIGYQSVSLRRVTLTGAGVDVGVVALPPDPVQLGAVEAAAARSAVVLEIDRTVYHTKEMPVVEGGSAADVLRHIDELEVGTGGDVRLRGDRTVAIHINGRPTPMKGDQLSDFLQQMPGRSIARVEVMPNPSARHDPEGMAGIVNLVLRDDVSIGISGSAGVNANTRGARGLTGRIAVQRGRLTFFGGGSGTLSDGFFRSHEIRRNLTVSPATYHEQSGTSVNSNRLAFGDFSAEYRIAERTTAWANGYASAHEHDRDRDAQVRSYVLAGEYIDQHQRDGVFDDAHAFIDIGAGVKHRFAERQHELTVDIRRNTNSASRLVESQRRSLDATADETDEQHTMTGAGGLAAVTFRADYIRPAGEGELAAGISIARRDSHESDTQSFESRGAAPLSERGDFRHEEDIDALYITITRQVKRLGVQLGLRTERARSRITADSMQPLAGDARLFHFPSASLAWQIDEGRSLRVAYSRRIGRPFTYLLNPRIPTIDPLTRFEGNPHLDPNRTDALSADFNWIATRGSFRLSAFLNRTMHPWHQIRTQDDGVLVARFHNIAGVRQVGGTITITKPAAGRLSGSLNAGIFHRRTDASNIEPGLTRSSWNWSAGTNSAFRLSSSASATANVNYIAPRDLPQGRQNGFIHSSIGVRQHLLNRRATLNLFVSDPFDVQRSGMNATGTGFTQVTRNVPSMRSANLSFTLNLGKMPEQQSRRETEAPPGS